MQKRYHADAVIQSAMRADKLLDQGDVEGSRVGERVVAAIHELNRLMPYYEGALVQFDLGLWVASASDQVCGAKAAVAA